MDKCGQQRVNHPSSRQTDTHCIDSQRSVEVLENHRSAPTSGFDCRDELPQIVSDQKHIRTRLGDFSLPAAGDIVVVHLQKSNVVNDEAIRRFGQYKNAILRQVRRMGGIEHHE